VIIIQNQYVGDIGDFGKYGFLKALCVNALRLGIVWYLVPNEGNSDGKFINYLVPSKQNIKRFKSCDPGLFETLKGIVNNGNRNIQNIRMADVLPAHTVYYEKPLSFASYSISDQKMQEKRLEHRKNWLQAALDTTQDYDIVFLDPDNGLEVNSIKRYHKRGPKYVYFDELAPFLQRGQSIIIYHHLCRKGSAEEQIGIRLKQIKESVQEFPSPWAVIYRRFTLRAFIVIPTIKHQEILYKRTKDFLNSSWSQHFDKDPIILL